MQEGGKNERGSELAEIPWVTTAAGIPALIGLLSNKVYNPSHQSHLGVTWVDVNHIFKENNKSCLLNGGDIYW